MKESDKKEHREVFKMSLELYLLKQNLDKQNIEGLKVLEDASDKLMELLKHKLERSDR